MGHKDIEKYLILDRDGRCWELVLSVRNSLDVNIDVYGHLVEKGFVKEHHPAKILTTIEGFVNNRKHVIQDTIVGNKEDRHKGVGSALVYIWREYVLKNYPGIEDIHGEFGSEDAKTKENEIARNEFWKSIGMTIHDNKKISGKIRNLKIKKPKIIKKILCQKS